MNNMRVFFFQNRLRLGSGPKNLKDDLDLMKQLAFTLGM